MGFTITEKILARVSGRDEVRAGDEVMAKPDFVIAYDFPGYTDVYFRQMKEDFGIARVSEPDRYAIFIDHMVPATTPKEEELHIGTRTWCAENGVALYERKGIGHQVAAEVGYAVPGAFVVHFDGHVSQLGTFGCLAMGIRRNLLEAFVRERISIKVPQTVRVNLRGTLQKGVMARDVFHHLVRTLGPASCRFQVLEVGGPALSQISTEGLQTITGLAMFTGAVTAIVNPDEERLAYALKRARKRIEPVWSDEDATYCGRARPRPDRAGAARRDSADAGEFPQPLRVPRVGGADGLSRLLRVGAPGGSARRCQDAGRAGRSSPASS